MSELLKSSRDYIEENKDKINKEYRHSYHLMGACSWINDPNGFSEFNGEYHMFYQTFAIPGKAAHWGHAKSKDLVKWENLPLAIAPDMPYDDCGTWSGGALEKDGKLYIIYTGNKWKTEERPQLQTQNVAISKDGIEFEKYSKNPVIDSSMLPEGTSKSDFRDPFIWKKGDMYYAVLGSCKIDDGTGQLLLFESKDLLNWKFKSVMLEDKTLGKMWECPNFLEVDDKTDVLFFSPISVAPEEHRFHNCCSSLYIAGKLDYETGKFTGGAAEEIDTGRDFYATQVLKAKDGRNILSAWMNIWNRHSPTNTEHGWANALILPREMEFAGNKLIQKPVREIEKYFKNEIIIQEDLSGEKSFKGIEGHTLHMYIDAGLEACEEFCIEFFKGEACVSSLTYNKKEGVLHYDSSKSAVPTKGHELETSRNGKRSLKVALENGRLELDIYLDRISSEVFINGGKAVMSNISFNPKEAIGIVFKAKGAATLNIVKHEIVL